MSKLKLYLDTSIISHLYAPDAPDKMRETLVLWDRIATGMYDIMLSNVVFEEIDGCKPSKRQMLYDFLDEIVFENINVNDTIREIADEIINQGILTAKKRNDCLHIGCAIYTECDILLSWNFKDMVNVETVLGVRKITNLKGFKNIAIYSPTNIIYKEV